MSKGKDTEKLSQVKLEDASKTPPPREPSCITVGSARDVLKGRTMEEFLREAEEEGRSKQAPDA